MEALGNSRIEAAYRERTRRSAELAMLRIVGSSDACARANDFGEWLRTAPSEVLNRGGRAPGPRTARSPASIRS